MTDYRSSDVHVAMHGRVLLMHTCELSNIDNNIYVAPAWIVFGDQINWTCLGPQIKGAMAGPVSIIYTIYVQYKMYVQYILI